MVLLVPDVTDPAPEIVPETELALTVMSPDTALFLVQPEELVTAQ